MEFSEKGPMDPMNEHFSAINGLKLGYNFHFLGLPQIKFLPIGRLPRPDTRNLGT